MNQYNTLEKLYNEFIFADFEFVKTAGKQCLKNNCTNREPTNNFEWQFYDVRCEPCVNYCNAYNKFQTALNKYNEELSQSKLDDISDLFK